jgi:hypothetical protein
MRFPEAFILMGLVAFFFMLGYSGMKTSENKFPDAKPYQGWTLSASVVWHSKKGDVVGWKACKNTYDVEGVLNGSECMAPITHWSQLR